MITGLPSLPPASPSLPQRSAVGPRREESVETRSPAESGPQPGSRQVLESPGRGDAQAEAPATPQVPEPAPRQREVFSRRPQDEENLPFSTRQALRAFADNAPSPGQQLGIELAGIDTYA